MVLSIYFDQNRLLKLQWEDHHVNMNYLLKLFCQSLHDFLGYSQQILGMAILLNKYSINTT